MGRFVRQAMVATWLVLVAGAARAVVPGPVVDLPVNWVWGFDRWNLGGAPKPIHAFRDGAVASDGAGFLAVWCEGALQGVAGPGGEPARSTGPDVAALRVSSAGVVLDAQPLTVAAEDASHVSVAYAREAGTYLVAWIAGAEVHAARVSQAGALLDPAPLAVGAWNPGTALWGSWPVLATDGLQFLVFHATGVTAVTAAGAVGPTVDLGLVARAAAFDGAGYFVTGVVPGDPTHVVGLRLDAAGARIDPVPIALPGGDAVVFDGTQLVVAWSPAPGLFAARVSTAGAVLDPAGVRLGTTWDGGRPMMAYDGLQPVLAHDRSVMDDFGLVQAYLLDVSGPPAVTQTFTGGVGPDRSLAIAANGAGQVMIEADQFVFNGQILYPPRVELFTTWATLSVTTGGTGAGQVSSSPAGIDCGAACSARFEVPATVTLTATAAPGSAFAGWSGACAGAGATCTVALSGSTAVEASFADVLPPVVQVPAAIHVVATSAAGAVVTFTATAHDAVSGDLVPTCTPESGSTFPPGITHVTCTATDAAGNQGSACFDVTVTVPAVQVSPLAHDFGDVAVGDSRITRVTVTSAGTAPIVVSGVGFRAGASAAFVARLAQPLPVVLPPGARLDVAVTFAPEAEGPASGVLAIATDAVQEPLVEVAFTGQGLPQPGAQAQLDAILKFFDASVANGTLQGAGPGFSGTWRRMATRLMLAVARWALADGAPGIARDLLSQVALRSDGLAQPPDFVEGPSTPQLHAMVEALVAQLGG